VCRLKTRTHQRTTVLSNFASIPKGSSLSLSLSVSLALSLSLSLSLFVCCDPHLRPVEAGRAGPPALSFFPRIALSSHSKTSCDNTTQHTPHHTIYARTPHTSVEPRDTTSPHHTHTTHVYSHYHYTTLLLSPGRPAISICRCNKRFLVSW